MFVVQHYSICGGIAWITLWYNPQHQNVSLEYEKETWSLRRAHGCNMQWKQRAFVHLNEIHIWLKWGACGSVTGKCSGVGHTVIPFPFSANNQYSNTELSANMTWLQERLQVRKTRSSLSKTSQLDCNAMANVLMWKQSAEDPRFGGLADTFDLCIGRTTSSDNLGARASIDALKWYLPLSLPFDKKVGSEWQFLHDIRTKGNAPFEANCKAH